MLDKLYVPIARRGRQSLQGIALLPLLLSAGCMSPLTKPAAAFSSATDRVIDNAVDVYQVVIDLHDEIVVSEAVVAFDTNPTWDPHKPLKVLLTADQIQARTQVLDALKAYASTLAELTRSKSTNDQDSAATSVGSGLQGLSTNAAAAFGLGSSSAATLSAPEANGVSTALVALQQYLAAKKVRSEVPQKIVAMELTISTLCRLLESDLKILTRQTDDDFEQEIMHQNSFIRDNGSRLSPVEHRNEIASMLHMVRNKRKADELLAKMADAIHHLDETHAALAVAARGGNNTEAFQQQLAQLIAAGESLGHYYSSISK